MGRLTIFAKGNLDVRDSLHSLRVGGVVRWNGINEICRARHPGTVVQLLHETWNRSDALLGTDGRVPEVFGQRKLDLGPWPLTAQFSRKVFETRADAIVLSVQPDVTVTMARHRRLPVLFNPAKRATWPQADQQWLRDEFAPENPLPVETSMRNLARIVERLRERSAAPILVYNMSAVVPGDTVHCHQGLDETLATRIRQFNLGLVELSQRTGISVIDVDAVVARIGADRAKLDVLHFSAEGCRRVAEETVRVLADLGVLTADGQRECA